MRKALVIEDDEFKREKLVILLNDLGVFEVLTAASVSTGVKKVRSCMPDVVLLDMSLPTYELSAEEEGGRPQGFGGREVLRQMERFDIAIPVIVVTQYATFDEDSEFLNIKELAIQLKDENPGRFMGLVYYDSASESWKAEIKRILEGLS